MTATGWTSPPQPTLRIQESSLLSAWVFVMSFKRVTADFIAFSASFSSRFTAFNTFKTKTDTEVAKIPACPLKEVWINLGTVRALLLLLLGYSHLLSVTDIIYCQTQLGAASSWRPSGCFYTLSGKEKKSFTEDHLPVWRRYNPTSAWTSDETNLFYGFYILHLYIQWNGYPWANSSFCVACEYIFVHGFHLQPAHPNWAKSNSFTLSEASCA